MGAEQWVWGNTCNASGCRGGVAPSAGLSCTWLCLPGARCEVAAEETGGNAPLTKDFIDEVLVPHFLSSPWGGLGSFGRPAQVKPVSPKSIFFLVGLQKPLELLELVPKGLSRTSCHSQGFAVRVSLHMGGVGDAGALFQA